MLYIPGFMVYFINTARLWHNKISLYFFIGQLVELFFNKTIFAYIDNVKNLFILYKSTKKSIFRIEKPTTDLKIQYNRLVYLSYQNVVANAKEIRGMQELKEPILIELYEPCMAGYQKLKILQTSMSKVTKFLERLNIDIERLLLIIFLGFQYFFFIIDDTWNMFFILPIKIKEGIYDKLLDF